MTSYTEKFQRLLRELFQFDCVDLDFGIYRIMNYKRDVIERFITKDLPETIGDELDRGVLGDQSQAARELKEVAQQIKETLGKDALDADGNLAEAYHNTPLGKKYLDLKARAAGSRGHEALEASIFNHLYTFFSRYYQDGDFISKRRYSRRQRYAIPYNGEEVYLYWANNDQYYVKTAEHFHDYTFSAHGVTVHFKLTAASVEQNNVKGDKRFFLPRAKETEWDEDTGQLVIPFEYRPLTEQEEITYGKKNQQEAIIAEIVAEIPKRLKKADKALAALTAERRMDSDGQPVTFLEHHLRQYTRRNTSDFFIHKDLKGFLSSELDFYLKNEVLNLDEMESAGEGRAEGWFQVMRVIKAIGERIIDFLDQIECFQKMLWEKRKFITETQYCITVGNIAEGFYPEIAACEPQWAEWKELGFIEEPGNAAVPAANKGWHSRGYLPHFDAGNTVQFVTFRLHDSVPADVIEKWKKELHWTEEAKADSEESVALRKKIDDYEDRGKGACHLRNDRIASLVQDALIHFDGQRYRLIDWCVMPNHVHVMIETMPGRLLSDIVHSWKSFTAHEANKLLDRSGDFWMPDYFDRYIRNEKHYAATVEYIRRNPVKAGLVDAPEKWPWSGSAAGYSDPCGRDARVPRPEFLKAHPTLVLDTKHFDADFMDRLLASFDDLDEMIDGLLIHSENFQALNLLIEKYRQRVQCIHIDPPYNTQTSGFLYKNDYQHSSWLAMVENRIRAGVPMMSPDGAYLCHIDENEYEILHSLFRHIDVPDGGTIVWDKKNPMLGRKGIATQHEYVLWRTWCDSPIYLRPTNVRIILAKAESLIRQHGGVNDKLRREFASWISNCDGLTGGEKAYRLINDDGRVYQSVAMGAPEPRQDPKFHIPLIHPVTKKECPVPSNGWSRAPETLQDLIEKDEIIFGEDETVQPRRKVFLTNESRRQLSSVISDAMRGKTDVEKLGLEFPYCHPVSLYEELLGAASPGGDDVVFDYFAGSGTTGHAVINLNREDGGRRKFVLVEMANYFDTVLLPRIKKVTFTPEWKDGKPKRMATPEEAERSPRIVKYMRLESYEDALNNIEFDNASGQQALKFEDYLLKYMLKWETRASETMLNVEKLARPFSYKLHIHADGRTHEKVADVPETFNYLLGLHVQTRKVYDDDGRRYLVYRGMIDHRNVAVIWRETEGWQKADLERDKKFVAERKLTEGADEIFVNSDSFIPNAKSLEPVFKARMFAEVQA